jgi:beta-ribofuranosylaminobenzene 5'-phosphate synthase
MSDSITVTVPARLHLGFLDLNGELGRTFGSVGLALGALCTRVTVSKATRAQVSGPDSDRARRYVETLSDALGLRGAHRVDIEEALPSHAGLGSGTQLALALAAAMRKLHGLPLDIRGDAVRVGRGGRSGVGIGLFDRGGVVVDGGRGPASAAAPVISRIPFPATWRVVLVLDPTRSGMHGAEESAAMDRLAPMPAATAAQICRLVLMQAMPALVEADLANFAAAISEMQALLGAYFAPVQGGGAFTSPAVAAALDLLGNEGARGRGQSSWGPTGFTFADTREQAEKLVALGRKYCRGLDIRACEGLNHGAHIATSVAVQKSAAMPHP